MGVNYLTKTGSNVELKLKREMTPRHFNKQQYVKHVSLYKY